MHIGFAEVVNLVPRTVSVSEAVWMQVMMKRCRQVVLPSLMERVRCKMLKLMSDDLEISGAPGGQKIIP